MNDGEEAPVVVHGAPYVYREPQTWDRGRPTFKTDDYEDLLDYMQDIAELIRLLHEDDEQEKKRLFVKYLPHRKKQNWTALEEFDAGSYQDFLNALSKSYPEILTENESSVEAMNKLCKSYKGITVEEEGRLRRFGVEFFAVAKKLMSGSSLLTNREACSKYLDTLDAVFAATLRLTISSTQLVKSTMAPALVVAGAPAAVPARRGDPIQIVDLIKMAETMAETQDTETRVLPNSDYHKRANSFPTVKNEITEAKIEALGETMNYLRDSFLIQQKSSEVKHAELLKEFQQFTQKGLINLRDRPPHEDLPKQQGNQAQARQNFEDRYDAQKSGCFYCGDPGHFSRECEFKQIHLSKQWIAVEDGKTRLGDGGYIPKGNGSQKQRVEEYWRNKSTSVNWYATPQGTQSSFYFSNDGEHHGDQLEAAHDEITTLRVQLARAKNIASQYTSNNQMMVQPTYMATTAPVPNVSSGGDIAQALQVFMIKGFQGVSELPGIQEQLAQTRTAVKNGSGF
jgi:hypothetical protein